MYDFHSMMMMIMVNMIMMKSTDYGLAVFAILKCDTL